MINFHIQLSLKAGGEEAGVEVDVDGEEILLKGGIAHLVLCHGEELACHLEAEGWVLRMQGIRMVCQGGSGRNEDFHRLILDSLSVGL